MVRDPPLVRTCTTGEETTVEDLRRRLVLPAAMHRVWLDRLRDPAAALARLRRRMPTLLIAWEDRGDPIQIETGAKLLARAVRLGAHRIQVTPAFLNAGALDRVLEREGAWSIAASRWGHGVSDGRDCLDDAYGTTRPHVFSTAHLGPGQRAWDIIRTTTRPPTDGMVVMVEPRSAKDWVEAARLSTGLFDCRYFAVEARGPWAEVVRTRSQDLRTDWIVVSPDDLPEDPGPLRLRAGPSLRPIVFAGRDRATIRRLVAWCNGVFSSQNLPWQAVGFPTSNRASIKEMASVVVPAGVFWVRSAPPGSPPCPEEWDLIQDYLPPDVDIPGLWNLLSKHGFVTGRHPPRHRHRVLKRYDRALAMHLFAAVSSGFLFRWRRPLPPRLALMFQALAMAWARIVEYGDFITIRPLEDPQCWRDSHRPILWADDTPDVVPYLVILGLLHHFSFVLDGSDRLRRRDYSGATEVLSRIGVRAVGFERDGHLPMFVSMAWPWDWDKIRREEWDRGIDLTDVEDPDAAAALVLAAPALPGSRRIRLPLDWSRYPALVDAMEIILATFSQREVRLHGNELWVRPPTESSPSGADFTRKANAGPPE